MLEIEYQIRRSIISTRINHEKTRERRREFSLLVVGSAPRPTCLVPRNIHGHYYVSKYHFQPCDYRKLEPSCLRAVLKEENYERKREREREMGPRKRDDTVMEDELAWFDAVAKSFPFPSSLPFFTLPPPSTFWPTLNAPRVYN